VKKTFLLPYQSIFHIRVLLLLLYSSLVSAQNPYIDSLNNQINTAHDTLKIKIHLELAFEYADSNFGKSVENGKKAFNIAQSKSNKLEQARALDVLGAVYSHQGDYATALNYKIKALKIYDEESDLRGEGNLSNNIGVLYFRQRDFNKALFYYQKALKIANQLQDTVLISTYMLNIGEVYYEEGDYDNALTFEQKAYDMSYALHLYDNEAYASGILGKIYAKKGNTKYALQLTKGALKLFKQIEDVAGEAEYLLAVAKIFQTQNQSDSALYYAYEALEVSRSMGMKDFTKDSYLCISEIYAKNQMIPEAYSYHKLYTQLKDSIYNESSSSRLAQMQVLYETDKKEKENELLRKDQALKAETIKAQRLINWIVGIAMGLILLLAFFLYRSNLFKQKTNQTLQLKNTEINQQKEEIETQRDAIELQRSEIEQKNRNINASINYASRIQNALLPFEKTMQTILPNHFVFFQPRDIVSGDSYWLETQGDKTLIAAIDCTGHGVPGAFMSMIADSLLNHIILDRGIWEVDEILTLMHLEIKKTLKQDLTENRDGMDLALCMIDKKRKVLEFAGAHNPLILIQNGEMKKIKGDKFGIGGLQLEKERVFKKHTFEIDIPTSFYIFSDGFQDQFGGKDRKKFFPRNFENILLEIHEMKPETQKNILKKTIADWMGRINEQVDDILVIGVNLNDLADT
jgi:serine phosphatase RsbU (regulator of sigma subunit)